MLCSQPTSWHHSHSIENWNCHFYLVISSVLRETSKNKQLHLIVWTNSISVYIGTYLYADRWYSKVMGEKLAQGRHQTLKWHNEQNPFLLFSYFILRNIITSTQSLSKRLLWVTNTLLYVLKVFTMPRNDWGCSPERSFTVYTAMLECPWLCFSIMKTN